MNLDVDIIIDGLGGTNEAARLAGVRPPSVSEWRQRGVIPEGPRALLAHECEKRGLARPWQLFPLTWHRIWPNRIGEEGAPAVAAEPEGLRHAG